MPIPQIYAESNILILNPILITFFFNNESSALKCSITALYALLLYLACWNYAVKEYPKDILCEA